MYVMEVFPTYYGIWNFSLAQAKTMTGSQAKKKKKFSSIFVIYFRTMHLLQLVQKQLQAAQKQANLLEGRDNLYQSVNVPIEKKKKVEVIIT